MCRNMARDMQQGILVTRGAIETRDRKNFHYFAGGGKT